MTSKSIVHGCQALLVCTGMIASCAASSSLSRSSGESSTPRTAVAASPPRSQDVPDATPRCAWDRMALDAEVLSSSDACAFSYMRLNHPRSYTIDRDDSDLAGGDHPIVDTVDCHGLPNETQAVLVTVQNTTDETVGVPLQLSRIYLELPDKKHVRASAILTSQIDPREFER